MTGLYIREMLSRRLIRRILIVPPAGLVGNWEQEMRKLFRLSFRIIRGEDARTGNPFSGAEGDRVIVSVDTLVTERVFNRLGEPRTEPYDLVVFDEAHKLAAARQPDYRVRKTNRYRLAEAIAGAEVDGERWKLPWSARHLLLLTATPHMGNDSPYYFLWRLLLPETLSTHDAFDRFPLNRASTTSSAARRGDAAFRRATPVPAAKLRHAELQSLGRHRRRAGTVRRNDGIHPRLLQPRGSPKSFRRAFGDECLSAPSRQLHLCPHAFL